MTRRELLLWAAVSVVFPALAQAVELDELDELDEKRVAQVKESLIHHLVQLTRWPDSARKSDAPVVVALYGAVDEHLARLLEERARQHSRPDIDLVRVRAASDPESKQRALAALTAANLAYMSPRDDPAIFAELRGKPVLTVGEGSGFAKDIGIVAFVIEARKVRIEVNLERARASQLGFSAQLLQHARIVE